MFCIQDPSYENSKYLHETLLTECVGSVAGAGAYAFATKDGIHLLFKDDDFIDFLKAGTYTLVVGMDDITNVHSIDALTELKNKYGKHLHVKAYVHSAKGSTFHPKFSWFRKANGGSLILGSGNLTQNGLRYNREAYNVIQYDEEGMAEVIAEWDRWYAHSAPFLFDIDDPVVRIKAELNSDSLRAMSAAKTAIKQASSSPHGKIDLSALYMNQPKNQIPREKRPPAKTPAAEASPTASDNTPVIADEEFDIDTHYWTINRESAVLIAEIPGGGNRWKQANFNKFSFEHYFGATCGKNGEYRILLKSVNPDGSMNATEVRPSVSVASRNYRFELDAANGLKYPQGNERPIAIFAKVSCRDFIYMLLMPGQEGYNDVMAFIGKSAPPSARMRRLQYTAKNVIDSIPDLAIWKRLEEEEN